MEGLAVVFFVTAAVCTGAEWNSFQLTYGRPGYYEMPWTVQEATARRKWLKIDEDDLLNVDVYAQPEDARVMLLFDKNENIAGMRMAFLKEDIQKKADEGGYTFDFDYDSNPMYEQGRYFGKDLYYTPILYQSPENLIAGGRKPLNKANDSFMEGLFFKKNRIWTEVEKDECKVDLNIFNRTNCYPGMGTHYFLKNQNEEDCAHRRPFLALYHEGRLSGTGLSGFAAFTKNPNTQSYYEDFPVGAIKNIMPDAPACIDDYVKKYGLLHIHVFFTKDAAKIACPTPRWSARCEQSNKVKKRKCNLKKFKNI